MTIPFYGSERPDLFEVERAAMDRPGLVIRALEDVLPRGLVLDVGAGDGFTAERLRAPGRTIVALEPAAGMRRPARRLPWVGAGAEMLPFADDSFDAAYATWAYFFSRDFDPTPGLRELARVVRPGGPLAIVDNFGDDEFTALAPSDITADPSFWTARGFEVSVVETVFEFANADDARELLRLYFGEGVPEPPPLRLTYRVGVFVGVSR